MSIRIHAPRHRKSPRLTGFDYTSRRWYFITIIAARRRKLFAALDLSGVRLSDVGRVVKDEWERNAAVRSDVSLDAFVVMPDHFHALIGLKIVSPAECRSSLSHVVGAFKGAVTRHARELEPHYPHEIWQRSFHDSIIRSTRHFERVQRYIRANPTVAWQAMRWPG